MFERASCCYYLARIFTICYNKIRMKKLTVKYWLVSLVLVVLVSLGLGCAYIEVIPPSSSPAPVPAASPAAPSKPLNPSWTAPAMGNESIPLPSIADVVALVKPSVVAITTEVVAMGLFNQPSTQKGAGSGWIIDENGIIVTNNHVVQGANAITATLDDGTSYTVDVNNVFTDPLNDLAILKVDAQNLPALKVGDSAKLRVGEWVVAIGNPLGQGISATQGIVSQLEYSLPVEQGQVLYDLIKTSAAINPGNSGGPLVNMAGEVIGITSAKLAAVEVEGIGFAISSATVLPIIQELVTNGYVVRPWLGVSLITMNEWIARRFDLSINQGVLIAQVIPGSPAEQAGLESGDVVASIDGEEVLAVEELTKILHSAEIDQIVTITFWRGETQMTIKAALAESPPPP